MRPPDNLTKAEEVLLAAVAEGRVADYQTGDLEKDDPAKGADWGSDRSLRAEVIRALCLSAWAHVTPDPKGICIQAARITGRLELEAVKVELPIHLYRCHIDEAPILRYASAKLLDLSGTFLAGGISCERMSVERALFLSQGFTAKGQVILFETNIGGDLDCSGGSFDNPEGDALFAYGMSVKGNVSLTDEFATKGQVTLVGADIGGDLDCSTTQRAMPSRASVCQSKAMCYWVRRSPPRAR